MTQFELFLLCVFLLLLGSLATRLRVLREPFRRAARGIKEFEEKSDAYLYAPYKDVARPAVWYVGGTIPYPIWVARKREEEIGPQPEFKEYDYVLDPRWHGLPYVGRDLRTAPDWEPGQRGFMEVVWWVVVVVFSGLVFGGIIWGLMNRAGA